MGAAKRTSQSLRRTVRVAVGSAIFSATVVVVLFVVVSGLLDAVLTQLSLNVAPLASLDLGQLPPVLWIACSLLALTLVIAPSAWVAHRKRRARAERRQNQEAAQERHRYDEAQRQQQFAEEREREALAEESRQQMIADRMPLAHRLGLSSALDLGKVAIEHFLALDGVQFELFMRDVLTLHGFQDVQHTGGPRDGGIDLKCRDQQGRPVFVQCKRYEPLHPVDGPTVKTFFKRVIAIQPDRRGLFVTTARYTSPACDFTSRHSERLQLVDGQLLEKMVHYLAVLEPDAPNTPPGEPLRPAA